LEIIILINFMTKLSILIGLAVATVSVYGGDSVVLHFRHDPVGSVVVERYDAIPEKNGKTEFAFEQPVTQRCVHALFPHMGYQTCWYLSRHTEQRINY
jgi:hypothetical protein